MNASWNGADKARLELRSKLDMRSYRLLVRKVIYNYKNTNFPTYGKWRGVQSRENKEDVNTQETEGDPRVAATTVMSLHNLDQAYSWEIRVIMKDDINKSASVFIDPPILTAGMKHDDHNNAVIT